MTGCYRSGAALLAAGLIGLAVAPARGVPASTGECVPGTLDGLARLSWPELEQLYRRSGPGSIPSGYAPGRPIYGAEEPLFRSKTAVTQALWHGKHFRSEGTLINQWTGVRAIEAQVGYGPSWLDGGPSIIMDYHATSRVWREVRDEIREVSPGVYVGLMYQRQSPQPRLKMYFALDQRR